MIYLMVGDGMGEGAGGGIGKRSAEVASWSCTAASSVGFKHVSSSFSPNQFAEVWLQLCKDPGGTRPWPWVYHASVLVELQLASAEQ